MTDPRHLNTEQWLIIDDDAVFCRILKKSLDKLGAAVAVAHDAATAICQANEWLPDYIILDLNIGQDNGIELIEPLLAVVPQAKILMLTGYASIATAVNAVKLGAYHYLPKPCSVDDILTALDIQTAAVTDKPLSEERLSLQHHEWEYIHQVLEDCGGNISEAARVLKMHRRTLQRKLQKKRKIDLVIE